MSDTPVQLHTPYVKHMGYESRLILGCRSLLSVLERPCSGTAAALLHMRRGVLDVLETHSLSTELGGRTATGPYISDI